MNYTWTFQKPKKEPAIFEAVYKKSVNELALLLDDESTKIHINDFNKGETPLHVAVQKDFTVGAKLLLEKGAKVDIENKYGCTPLYYAISRKNHELVEILVEKTNTFESVNAKSLLHIAVVANFEYAVDLLLAKGCEVNIKCPKTGDTPLHYALKSNDINFKLVKKLLNNDPDYEDTNNKGETLLHLAVAACNPKFQNIRLENATHLKDQTIISQSNSYAYCTDTLEYYKEKEAIFDLILANTVNITLQDKCGKTPLHLAVKRPTVFLNKLLTKGVDLNIKDSQGQTPLHLALYCIYKAGYNIYPYELAAKMQLQSVKKLIMKGADVRQQNEKGETALHLAVSLVENVMVICELLLTQGADVNAIDRKGQTPLHYAANKFNDTVVCELLVAHGADLNVKDNIGQTPLHLVTNDVVCEMLITQGADVKVRDSNNQTPLHSAAMKDENVCKVLLAHGADVNAKDKSGRTPLHVAPTMWHSSDICELLLKNGADVNVKDNYGDTPLLIATRNKNANVCKVFVTHGADVNIKDKQGQAPLHIASETGSRLTCEVLLTHGAYINMKNNTGKTPLDIASNYHEASAFELLITYGAKINNIDTVKDRISSCGKSFTEAIEEHIITCKCANLVCDIDFEVNKNKMYEFEMLCMQEVEKMKIRKFGHFSLFRVFFEFNNPTFVSNKELLEKIYSYSLCQEFPIYSSLLKATFSKAKLRGAMFNEVQHILQFPLPSEMVMKILSFVDYESLRNVIKATKDI